MNQKQQLCVEVQRFREWADATFPVDRYGEWETEYEDWDALYLAAKAVIANGEFDGETTDLLIYTIARDNEVEFVVGLLSESQLLFLADASVGSGEPHAKWQLAVRLGELPIAAEPERILLGLLVDSDEYVRRRALMALANLGSSHVESLAMGAWLSGEQYQRMACLDALHRVASPQLPEYLDLAERDGRPYLVAMADKMKRDVY